MARTGRRGSRAAGAIAAALLVALAGCAPAPGRDAAPAPRPSPRPAAAPAAPPGQSAEVAAYYARIEADFRRRGLMRTDGGGPDAPFGPRQLTEHFLRIALYDEYVRQGDRLMARASPAPLRRWAGPVRIGLRFGESVTPAQRLRDRTAVAAYAARLARVTGHPIRFVDEGANFRVYVVGEFERPAMMAEWAGFFRGVAASELAFASGIDLGTFCLAVAVSEGQTPVYTGALAVVRAELPDLLRQSCFHEEIAQGLGLANDSPAARPSIFNDDEEFALLTRLDELMLRILYDPRLRPGMREAEARPIVEVIAAELLGGGT